jgi:RNA polymerase subunit RPABC4/transcription elongation factor Spt4
MVRGRISPKTKDRFRKSIRDVVKGLSRKVQIYKQPIKQECPNCYYDKLTGRSTGKCKWSVQEAEDKQRDWALQNPGTTRYKYFRVGRCPICRGEGYLEIKRRAWADCLVIWNPENRYNNELTYTAAGTEGSTLVQLKTDPKHYDTFKNCDSIIVDGVNCKLSKPPVLRGLGNQAVLIISAFTTEKPKLDSGEIIKEYT